MALSVGHRIGDSQVVGSTLGGAPLRSGLGQATYTCVLLSPNSIIWYLLNGSDVLRLESNGSLLLDL